MSKPAVPFIDLFTREKGEVLDGILEDFRKVVQKSQFILGDAVGEFEAAFARAAGCEFGVGVNSGLDALILGLRALNIGPGDEVITAPNSFIASAAAISLVGAKPVFADVGWDYNLDIDKAEAAVTSKTKAIVPVHLTGKPCQMEKLGRVAKKHGLKIVEDAAQAIGATYDGQAVGSFGDIGAFSLHPLKNLHVWGDGGMTTVRTTELAQQIKLQRNHGLKNRDEVEFYSYNSRLDTLQAVVGLRSLGMLEGTTQRRMRNAALYRRRLAPLSDVLILQPVDESRERHVYHVFQVRARERDTLKTFLQERGVETKIHYPLPIHWQKASAHLGYKKGDFPVTDRLAGEILSLPVRENLTEDEVNMVCDLVTEFYQKRFTGKPF